MRRAPFVSIVAGPQKSRIIPGLVQRAGAESTPVVDLRMDDETETPEIPHVARSSPWQASVTISEGCSRACSFCVVPFTRGRERNRPAGAIIREVEELAARNYVEVLLLGQTVNSYRDPESGLSFAGLLRRLAGIPGLARIRFTSPHPSDFTAELLEVMVSCPQVCNQIHLPVQSGSTAILRSMRRGYTRERYLETIRRIKAAPRPIAISTDLIVGFPGESEADFRDTLTLLDEVQFDSAFSFKYSPRPNTKALELQGEVSEQEKGRRLMILQEQQRVIQYNKNAAYQGRVVDVLVDGRPKSRFSLAGRTTENKIVNFDGPDSLMGRIVPVLIGGFSANSLKGIRVEEGQEGQ
jgi:tRNA-2-methylthio-N6-dimethylallyladenosine synthase